MIPATTFFRRVFEEYGLPKAIRTDNGPPFASWGLLGLTKLSAYWLKLGIELERIEPGLREIDDDTSLVSFSYVNLGVIRPKERPHELRPGSVDSRIEFVRSLT